jgi:hypothetical protein
LNSLEFHKSHFQTLKSLEISQNNWNSLEKSRFSHPCGVWPSIIMIYFTPLFTFGMPTEWNTPIHSLEFYKIWALKRLE